MWHWMRVAALFATVLALAPAAHAQRPPERELGALVSQPITRDWTFTYLPAPTLDETIAAPTHDDRTWPAVALPHTWSTFETTRDLHPFIKSASERDDPYWWRGWGWYRKHLVIAKAHLGKKISVEFDGVQKYSRVYLNGKFLGEHKGGYTSFSVDLTDAVRFGADNVLAVAVSNRRDDLQGGIAPMTAGNFNVYGGIYREARLVVKDRLHFPYQGSADHEGGIWVTTPEVSARRATVRVRSWVRNDHATPQVARLTTEIRDPSGALVQTMRATKTLAPGATETFDQIASPLTRPHLWSVEKPALYKVTSTLLRDATVVATLDNPLGFRWFRWDRASKRLILNGKPVVIAGTNRHQDYPWLGDAVPRDLHAAELREIRTVLGHNFIRAAHYPNDPAVYDATDRLGLITVEEVPNIKSIDFGEEAQRRNLTEMIRRDRNHPSILFWSVGNETDDPVDSCLAKSLDPDRLVHARKVENAGQCVDHDHTDLDLETLLRVTVRGWETSDALENPGGRPMTSPNGQTASTEEWAHAQARIEGGSVRGRIDKQGVAWLYADHGADRRYENAPLDHVNAKGWVDLYRFPKTIYGLWQANWTTTPMVRVHSWYWQRRYVGQRKPFQVDSNCGEVELLINGRSVDKGSPNAANQHSVAFQGVTVAPGTLIARCTDRPGVEHVVPMAGPAARVKLSIDRSRIAADRAGLAFVTADIVDADDVPVQGASSTLNWSVSGPARLVGPATYTSDKEYRLAAEGTGYITTPVRNIVRSTAEPGRIMVSVTAKGLAGDSVSLESVAPAAPIGSGIAAPALSDAGRRPVQRDVSFDPLEGAGDDAPQIARIENENVSFPPSTDDELRRAVAAFVTKRNPTLPTETPAFSALVDRLMGAVKRTNRQLIPDDFNFAGDNFNDASRLAELLTDIGLPQRFRTQLDRYFADLLITRGRTVDIAALRALYATAAKGARIFAPVATGGPAMPTYDSPFDVWRVQARDIQGLIERAYPSSADRDALAKRIALLNPHVAGPAITPDALLLVPAQ